MQRSNKSWLVVCFAVALGVSVGCSSDDNPFNVPADEAVEAGLDEAIQTTVVPVVDFMDEIGDFLAPPPAAVVGGLACPNTAGWCSTGTASCTVANGNSFNFNFDECQVVTGDEPLLLDGDINALPSGATVYLTLINLFINNNPAVSGTGSINVNTCTYLINVNTSDTGINGTYVQCDSDNYPTGQVVTISFGDFVVTITLSGGNTAPATATQGGNVVANCTINLDTLTSSCSLP